MYLMTERRQEEEEERQREGRGEEGGETERRRRDREKEETRTVNFLEIHFKNLHATTKKTNDKQLKFCPNSQPTLPAALVYYTLLITDSLHLFQAH